MNFRTSRKIYMLVKDDNPKGICDACGTVGLTHKDHRIPKRMDGTDDIRNLHYLCIVCHRRKTNLELFLCVGMGKDKDYSEWFALAVPAHSYKNYVQWYLDEWADKRLGETTTVDLSDVFKWS